MPDQIVDYPVTGAIGRVERCHAIPINNVDMGRLIEAIRRSSTRFETRVMGFPRGQWNINDFIFLEPTHIELGLFPLTFFCRKCKGAFRFGNIGDFRTATRKTGYKCPKCQGDLEQSEIVHYHTCGVLEPLAVRQCTDPTHGTKNIFLDKGGSNSIKNWWWRCGHPSHGTNPLRISRVGAWCYQHQPAEMMTHGPFRRSEVYYSESVSMVNVPPLGGQPNERVWSAVFAEYLGIAQNGLAKRLASGDRKTEGELDQESARQKLLNLGMLPDDIEKTIQALGIKSSSGEVENAITSAKSLMKIADEDYSQGASKIYEYLQIVNGQNTKPLSKVIQEANGPQGERVRNMPRIMKVLGLSDAHITTAFPLVKAIYGFSRGDPERKKSTLRAFPGNEDYRGKNPIYGAVTDTEAIVITLDRGKVYEWLKLNQIIDEPSITDEMKLKTWFLNNVKMSAIPPYDEIDGLQTTTKWVYRLAHSLSHLLIRHASSIAGIDRDSLGEVLFPNVPAFAIYTNNSQNFSLGGLYTLFENSMSSWLETAAEEVRYCLNDPSCIDSERACFACLHLAEVSCEHFNRELGRDTIIGVTSNGPRIGYWSPL
jgi:hypothetical protein